MEIQVAVSKINKYATSESGDTLEMIERPNGGISFVLVVVYKKIKTICCYT